MVARNQFLGPLVATPMALVRAGVVAGAGGGHCSGFHSGVGGHGEHVGRAGAAAVGEATLCVFMSETVIGLN